MDINEAAGGFHEGRAPDSLQGHSPKRKTVFPLIPQNSAVAQIKEKLWAPRPVILPEYVNKYIEE